LVLPALSADWLPATWPITRHRGYASGPLGAPRNDSVAWAKLGAAASAWPLLVAGSTDSSSLAALARATRVVATTAGPNRPHGLALVEACATAASTTWTWRVRCSSSRTASTATTMWPRARTPASCTVAGSTPSPRTSPCCCCTRRSPPMAPGDLEDTTLVVKAAKGGFSGGTLASGKLQLDEVAGERAASQGGRRPVCAQSRARGRTRARRRA
jgi:hypothetical protein